MAGKALQVERCLSLPLVTRALRLGEVEWLTQSPNTGNGQAGIRSQDLNSRAYAIFPSPGILCSEQPPEHLAHLLKKKTKCTTSSSLEARFLFCFLEKYFSIPCSSLECMIPFVNQLQLLLPVYCNLERKGHNSESALLSLPWVSSCHLHPIPAALQFLQQAVRTLLPFCVQPPLGSLYTRPCGANGKELACQCRRCKRRRFYPWVGRIPWRRAWQPTPVFLPGKSH